MKDKVLVAMSGGVDSSVAAFLLAEDGYDVTGVTMCLGVTREGDKVRCCGRDAVEDARAVCDRLKIDHFAVDFAEQMKESVIDAFISEYRRGRTPNPCLDCNRHLKFGLLLELARAMGFRRLATGHYARIAEQGGRARLLRPTDLQKDQTYFLYTIRREDLPSISFPLGGVTKAAVRDIARQAGLPVADKEESQDICFVPDEGYRAFLEETGDAGTPGDIVDRDGAILGRHRGIALYTIGQRSGLGISAPTPLYVTRIDTDMNRIVVGKKEDLRARGLIAADLNILADGLPGEAEAKIRYRKRAASCRVAVQGERLRVMFAEPQESVTPGQAVVLYQGDEVLGGGVIEEALP